MPIENPPPPRPQPTEVVATRPARRPPDLAVAIRRSAHELPPMRSSERGQATAEYALVMLAAAALAGLLLAWASSTDGIDRLLDAVLDTLIGRTG